MPETRKDNHKLAKHFLKRFINASSESRLGKLTSWFQIPSFVNPSWSTSSVEEVLEVMSEHLL